MIAVEGVSFLGWFVLFRMQHRHDEPYAAAIKNVQQMEEANKTLKHDLEFHKSLASDFQSQLEQQEAFMRKAQRVLLTVADTLITWEKGRGQVSAEQTLYNLKVALNGMGKDYYQELQETIEQVSESQFYSGEVSERLSKTEELLRENQRENDVDPTGRKRRWY